MTKSLVLCSFGLVANDESCGRKARYRAEARTQDHRRAVLYLCADHIHRAWYLGQLALDKKFPGQSSKIKSIHLHQLLRVAAAEAAS